MPAKPWLLNPTPWLLTFDGTCWVVMCGEQPMGLHRTREEAVACWGAKGVTFEDEIDHHEIHLGVGA